MAGQPKRHLLTTGWSVFVSAKRLVAGDSVIFIWSALIFMIMVFMLLILCRVYESQRANSSFFFLSIGRNEKNQLLLGIRRACRPQTVMPSSVLSSDSMHIGLLAAAAHAAATNSRFTIFYNPRQKFDSIITVLHVVLFLLTAMNLQFSLQFSQGMSI